MLTLGSLAFATPWMLAALILLPALWWLLRLTPPSPRVLQFPAMILLRDLFRREETPARTPLWLVLLRILLVTLAILALAQPILNPSTGLPGSGPVLMVIDNGWAAARDWPARRRAMETVIAQAERSGREIILVGTARPPTAEAPQALGPMRAADARNAMQTLEPRPWPVSRKAAADAIAALRLERTAHAIWFSDGLEDNEAAALARQLEHFLTISVLMEGEARPPHLLLPPAADGGDLTARLLRTAAGSPEPIAVRASAQDGRMLTRAEATFPADGREAQVKFDLPSELRNEITRLQIENESTAGSTVLLDERWRRRPVGLVSGQTGDANQPYLGDLYYLERALAPFSELRRGDVMTLLERELAVLVLSDVGALTPTEEETVRSWVARGGVLLRFAGPRMAQGADTLLPVRLRRGDRMLGGALSWSQPAGLAPFAETSPLAGLAIPSDVTVTRQVLAEPSLDLAEKTWARLVDGTPLITAEKRDKGWVILAHTTATPDWSDFSMSGLFVDVLRRIVALSAGVAGTEGSATLRPLRVFDGFGRLVEPPPTALPIAADAFAKTAAEPRHPPGFYGAEDARRALNLTNSVTTLSRLSTLPATATTSGYGRAGEVALKPWLLAAALAICILDVVIALALRGLLPGLPRRRAVTAALLFAAVFSFGTAAQAQSRASATDDAVAIEATSETYLAYVITGDPELDSVSKMGLEGLSRMLGQRTAAESFGARGIDLEREDLAFYPLIYWPVSQTQRNLSDAAIGKVNTFMRNGGMILFDTKDAQFGRGGPGSARLRTLAAGLDIPPLAPVPPEHVLTKAFYLLQDFPGRYTGGEVWVEAREGNINDGVSPVVVGSHDWASAWAIDANGRPQFPVVPGGERQREMAYRFGVNLVMYALTGNYKADQVHVPFILERLGQ